MPLVFHHGAAGSLRQFSSIQRAAHDLAFVALWGFNPAEVTAPTFVWQGSEDLIVPFTHGQWLSAHVPGATARLERGEGHLSILVGALDRMFDELMTTLTN